MSCIDRLSVPQGGLVCHLRVEAHTGYVLDPCAPLKLWIGRDGVELASLCAFSRAQMELAAAQKDKARSQLVQGSTDW